MGKSWISRKGGGILEKGGITPPYQLCPKIKLQRLRKIRILTFGSFVHQINSFQEFVKLEQIFPKK